MNTPQAETNVDTVEPSWHMRILTPKTGTVSGHSQDFSGATADSIPGWCGSNVLGDPLMSQIFYHILSENKKNLSCYFSEILKFSMENRTNINKSVLLQLNVKTYFHMAKIKIDINILLTSINI